MWLSEDSERKAFWVEDGWLKPVWMESGETRTLNLLFDWEREGVVKDWSATAWGENGEVKVMHNDGIPTRHMPSSGLRESQDEEEENDE